MILSNPPSLVLSLSEALLKVSLHVIARGYANDSLDGSYDAQDHMSLIATQKTT